MATIHLLKEGIMRNGDRLTYSIQASSEEIEAHFAETSKAFSKKPPTVHPDIVASEWDEYRHIVVEVNVDEISGAFPDAGYYLLKDVSPRDYSNVFSERLPVL